MSEFEIQRGLPVPHIQKESTKYPWPDMQDGDCIFVNEEDGGQYAAQSARQWVKKHRPTMSVVSRTIQGTEDEPTKIGIWFVQQDDSEVEEADDDVADEE